MTFFQTILLCFAFVGIGHTFVLIMANIGEAQAREKWKRNINVKSELAGILFLFFIVLLYYFLGEGF